MDDQTKQSSQPSDTQSTVPPAGAMPDTNMKPSTLSGSQPFGADSASSVGNQPSSIPQSPNPSGAAANIPTANDTLPHFPSGNPTSVPPTPPQAPPVPPGSAMPNFPAPATPPQTPPPAQTPSPSDTAKGDSNHAGSGKLVFVIVFILIILAVIGGYLLYTLSQADSLQEPIEQLPRVSPVQPSPTESPSASESAIKELETVSQSDEVSALEEDVANTNLTELDEGITEVEQGL